MTFIQLPKALMEIALTDSMADLGDIVAVADVFSISREEDVNRRQRRSSQWLPNIILRDLGGSEIVGVPLAIIYFNGIFIYFNGIFHYKLSNLSIVGAP